MPYFHNNLILFLFLVPTDAVCPLQHLKESENINHGVKAEANSFHNADGTSEVGGYGTEKTCLGCSRNLTFDSEGMGAIERAGMSRSDKEAWKTGNSEISGGSESFGRRGMHSSSASSAGTGDMGSFSQRGAYDQKGEFNQEGAYGKRGAYGLKTVSGVDLYGRNKTIDPSGASWGSRYSGMFGTEGMVGARGSSWKSGNTGGFGQMEILQNEGESWRKRGTGAFGDGEALNGEDYLPARGMRSALGFAKMNKELGHAEMHEAMSQEKMNDAMQEEGMRGAVIRAGVHENRKKEAILKDSLNSAAENAHIYEALGHEKFHESLANSVAHANARAAIRSESAQRALNHENAHEAGTSAWAQQKLAVANAASLAHDASYIAAAEEKHAGSLNAYEQAHNANYLAHEGMYNAHGLDVTGHGIVYGDHNLEVTGHGGVYGAEQSLANRLSVNGSREARLLGQKSYFSGKYDHHPGFHGLDGDVFGSEPLSHSFSENLDHGFASVGRQGLHQGLTKHF